MWIKSVITLNWGTLPNREYPLGEVTLLAGHTGSGKSTLEDAIQTVMTAAYQGLYEYNPGQDESKQGSRSGKKARSLASYILGSDRDRYARPGGAHGYVVLVFAPSGNEDGHFFSAVFGVTAHLEEIGAGEKMRRVPREDHHQMMLVSGEVRLDQLADRKSEYVIEVVDTKLIYNRLREDFGREGVKEFTSKETYLSALWGRLHGRSGGMDTKAAKRASLTFSQAMAYKPIKSIDRFVKEEILKPKDVGADVAHLSNLVQRLHKMRDDAETINLRTDQLASLLKEADSVVRGWQSRCETLFVKAAGKANKNTTALEASRQARTEAQRALDRAEATYDEMEQRLQQLNSLREQLERQRSNHPQLSQRGELEGSIERLQGEYERQRNSLRLKAQSLEAIRNTLRALRETPQSLRSDSLFSDGFKALEDALTLSIGLDSENLHDDLIFVLSTSPTEDKVEHALTRMHKALCDAEAGIKLIEETISGETGLKSTVAQHFYASQGQESAIIERRESLNLEIRGLSEQSQIEYPKDIKNGISILTSKIPEAKPRILCDLVEVRKTEEDWQNAIEGYLGKNRFMILVEDEFEVEANRLLRQHPAKVAQTHRAMKRFGNPLPTDSIIDCLIIDDPVAEAYLKAAYGDVVKVPDLETLKKTARGITVEGRSAGGFSTGQAWVDDRNLAFGESGRTRRLVACQDELSSLETTLLTLGDRRSLLQGLHNQLGSLVNPDAAETVASMMRARNDLNETNQRLSLLDIGDGAVLESQYHQAKEDTEAAIAAKEEAATARGIANRDIGLHTEETNRLQQVQIRLNENREESREVLEWLDTNSPDYIFEAQEDALLAAASGYNDETSQALDKRVTGFEGQVAQHLTRYIVGLSEYNGVADTYQQISWDEGPLPSVKSKADFSVLLRMIHRTEEQHQRHEGHLLAQAEQQLKELAAEVNTAITANFCQVINRSLQSGREQINQLNRSLSGYQFNDETYRFRAESIKEMLRYSRLFDELSQAYDARGERLDLFAGESSGLTEGSQATLDELLALLEQGDQGEARTKLDQITDYRNYHLYDVIAHSNDGHEMSLGENATGSGGQTETPAYIIRLAAISNAYGLNVGQGLRLRSIVLDEAFSKMDEPRTAEVLRLFADPRFRFQVVFAMPTKNAGAFQPLLTHKYVFTRTKAAQPQGELPNRTLVKLELVNQDTTGELYKTHLKAVEVQARMEFDAEYPEDKADNQESASEARQ
ncbi:MAG: SbcC/MukB-like Walker B domain-containing protein [Candidatus Thiodiazotropha sp.]